MRATVPDLDLIAPPPGRGGVVASTRIHGAGLHPSGHPVTADRDEAGRRWSVVVRTVSVAFEGDLVRNVAEGAGLLLLAREALVLTCTRGRYRERRIDHARDGAALLLSLRYEDVERVTVGDAVRVLARNGAEVEIEALGRTTLDHADELVAGQRPLFDAVCRAVAANREPSVGPPPQHAAPGAQAPPPPPPPPPPPAPRMEPAPPAGAPPRPPPPRRPARPRRWRGVTAIAAAALAAAAAAAVAIRADRTTFVPETGVTTPAAPAAARGPLDSVVPLAPAFRTGAPPGRCAASAGPRTAAVMCGGRGPAAAAGTMRFDTAALGIRGGVRIMGLDGRFAVEGAARQRRSVVRWVVSYGDVVLCRVEARRGTPGRCVIRAVGVKVGPRGVLTIRQSVVRAGRGPLSAGVVDGALHLRGTAPSLAPPAP